MAKGFTVKAKAPAQPTATQTGEWDYELAKQMVRGNKATSKKRCFVTLY